MPSVTESTRSKTRSAAAELFERLDIPEPLVHVPGTSALARLRAGVQPRPVPPGALAGAMLSWMSGVFALCYVALPLGAAAVGLNSQLLTDIFFNLPGFVMGTVIAVVAACLIEPEIRMNAAAPRDPVVAAWAGGLLSWAIVHNVTWFLRPFADFGALELLAFVGTNVVEMALIGMMLASFTRSPVKAFGLGVAFHLLTVGILGAIVGL